LKADLTATLPVSYHQIYFFASNMATNLKSIIVGTAGHIDHGKSTLIERLTGTHPDRLEEEKRRGITIDLGFAFLEDDGVRYGFVDVPGHERFVKNMLAGASGIDLVLLVIAADELIKPQTREHFDICRLLGVERGVIAMTKSDLADSDTRELARMEIEEFVKGTFLAKAPIVEVSAKTQQGLPELKTALREAAREISAKDTGRYFRLPIDRSFAVKGFGSVVTGTLFSGQVAVGDEVELLPSGKVLRVRGLETGGKSVERAGAGQRTAVNLAGVEHTAIQRGMVLSSRGRLRTTRRADVRLELLPGAPALKHRARVHFHAGTLETIGEVYLLGARELAPGGSAPAQIRLQDEAALLGGDRFIVRQFSPVVTIGGGEVLDPHAKRFSAKDTGRTQFLGTLQTGSREDIVRAMAERNVLGITGEEIIIRTGWIETEIQSAAKTLGDKKLVRVVSNEPLIVVAEAVFAEIGRKLLIRVERFHKENPLLPGITREELKASLGRRVRPETFAAALELLLEQKKITLQGEFIKKAGAEITLAPEELRAQEQIIQAFLKAGLAVPSVKEVLAQLKLETARAEKLLQILLREKVLVRVSADLIFHRDALNVLTGLLAQYKKAKGDRIGVPAFKELTGITRKYAIPLLEYLDRQRQTRRAGDERVIL
jgi:selenocysteine-specific elongation factor